MIRGEEKRIKNKAEIKKLRNLEINCLEDCLYKDIKYKIPIGGIRNKLK